jgi:hypothetical protein
MEALEARVREREEYREEQRRLGSDAWGSQAALRARRKLANPLPAHIARYHELSASQAAGSPLVNYRWKTQGRELQVAFEARERERKGEVSQMV